MIRERFKALADFCEQEAYSTIKLRSQELCFLFIII